jgi:autotransporter-associated beta strand protein
LQVEKLQSLYHGDSADWTKGTIQVDSGATLVLGVGGSGQFAAGDVNTLLGNLTTGTGANGMKAGSNIGFDTSNSAGAVFSISTPIADRTGEGAGSLGLVKLGSGTLVMNGLHTYTGATTIQEGTLKLGNSNALSSQSALNLAGASAVLDFSQYSSRSQTLASLSGVVGSRIMLGSYGDLTFGGDQSSTSFAGSVVG